MVGSGQSKGSGAPVVSKVDDDKLGGSPPADWMDKLPPDIRAKVNAVLYEGWPKEEDLMTVRDPQTGKMVPNQTQGLIAECGKAVSASWSPTKTFIAVGSPESWGVVASVTAPAGWALLGRDLHDPEDYTLVSAMNSLTETEKMRIKEGTAWFVNGCKFYASEEGLDDIVTKSTPLAKRGYRVAIITVDTGRLYSLKYMNATNQALICREEKLLAQEVIPTLTEEQKKLLNTYHAEYWYKAKVETKRLAELSAFLLDGPVEVLDTPPPKGEEYPGGYKVALMPKVSFQQVQKELTFDEYKDKELYLKKGLESFIPAQHEKFPYFHFPEVQRNEEVTVKAAVFEYTDRLTRVVFKGKTQPSPVGCFRPLLQAKETELLVPEIDGKKLNLSEQQRRVLHSYNKCAFLRAKGDAKTFCQEFARLVTSIL